MRQMRVEFIRADDHSAGGNSAVRPGQAFFHMDDAVDCIRRGGGHCAARNGRSVNPVCQTSFSLVLCSAHPHGIRRGADVCCGLLRRALDFILLVLTVFGLFTALFFPRLFQGMTETMLVERAVGLRNIISLAAAARLKASCNADRLCRRRRPGGVRQHLCLLQTGRHA